MSGPEVTGGGAVDAARRARVERAAKAWSDRLMDLSRRNRLFHYRPLKAGSLMLEAGSEAMRQLLSGRRVAALDLARRPRSAAVDSVSGQEPVGSARAEVSVEALGRQVRAIVRKAVENEEERGLMTLFVAIDLVTWRAEDGRDASSPLALVPVGHDSEGLSARAVSLQVDGEVVVNPALAQALARAWGVAPPEDADDDEQAPEVAVEALRRWADAALSRVPGASRQTHASLENLSFQKMAMMQELLEETDALAAHDLIAGLAGDPGAAAALQAGRASVCAPEALDALSPEEEHLVVDADSSQLRIAVEANRGQSGVIHGPPGTGKSQTITNLIASLIARGKRVLFVAEKRAALDVVRRRLEGAGLGHCVLDLHGADVSRRAIAQQLGQAVAAIGETPPVDATRVHRAYVTHRDSLRQRRARLHTVSPLTGETLHETLGRLLEADRTRTTARTRWRGAELSRLDAGRVERIERLFSEALGVHRVVRGDERSRWVEAASEAGTEAILEALDGLGALSRELPGLLDEARRVAASCGVAEPLTLARLRQLLVAGAETREALGPWKDGVLALPVGDLAREVSVAGRGRLATVVAFLFRASFRAARRALREVHATPAPLVSLWQAATRLAEGLRRWKEAAPLALPARSVSALEALSARVGAVEGALGPVERLLGGAWRDLRLEAVGDHAEALLADRALARRLPAARKVRDELLGLGVGAFLDEAAREDLPAERWPACFKAAWRASVVEQAQFEADLFGVEGATLDRTVEAFRESDRARVELARSRVRRAHAEHAVEAWNRDAAGHQLLARETAKKTRHLPFRTLLERASRAVTATCPCVLASPLSVSQLLPARSDLFDVVIFDEASQVQPEDAVPALLRAPQAIVAGDPRQLPPTTFFASPDAAGGDGGEGEEEAGLGGIESILDALLPLLPSWRLAWHYRSRDERLIAFANRHIYGDGLVTFPSARVETPVAFHLAPGHTGGAEESSETEARLVVEAVLAHARRTPDRSLGVITMGMPHRDRIQSALDELLPRHPELQAFFAASRDERFFVKNLEQVQGDERDVIFLSVGYGKRADGQLPFRFGPINLAGGERRLNVAVTRSRERMEVFASFSDLDMDERRIHGEGVRMLRDFLAFARLGGQLPAAPESAAGAAASPLEEDVRLALEARGVQVVPRLGVSRYRVDLAVKDPSRPGEYLLAIECDGASWAAAPTTRDRDRLRQQQLASLGWRIHRVWSTDWFNHRERELEACLSVIARAAAEAREAAQRPLARPVLPEAAPLPTAEPPRPAVSPSPPATQKPVWPPRTWATIDQVPPEVLLAIVRWACSDGRLRTDDQIVQLVLPELGFERSGSRIRAAILEALAVVRGR